MVSQIFKPVAVGPARLPLVQIVVEGLEGLGWFHDLTASTCPSRTWQKVNRRLFR